MCVNNDHKNKSVYVEPYTNYLSKLTVYCIDCGAIISTQFVDTKNHPYTKYDTDS
jgi:hypothetical protein